MKNIVFLNLKKTWDWLEDYYLSLATIPNEPMSACFKVVAQMSFQHTENTFLQHLTHKDPNLTPEQNNNTLLEMQNMLGKAMQCAAELLHNEASRQIDPDLITEVIEVGQRGLLSVYFKE